MLSIQTFICNGVIYNGRQNVLVNAWDEKLSSSLSFYQMIPVELEIRNRAKDVPNVFFLILFACSRDSYVLKSDENKGERNITSVKSGAARGDGNVTTVKIANFTFVFGSNPATGAQSDADFVKMFIQHLNDAFDPEDDSLMLPECLGNIDTLKGKVNFESTSANVGRSLKLKKQTNRVLAKQIIVIVQNPADVDSKEFPNNPDNFIEDGGFKIVNAKKLMKPRTELMLDFFVNDLGFDRESVLYFTEYQVLRLVKLLD